MEEGEIGSEDANSFSSEKIISNDKPKELQDEKCVADEKLNELNKDGADQEGERDVEQNRKSMDSATVDAISEVEQGDAQLDTEPEASGEPQDKTTTVQEVKGHDVVSHEPCKKLSELGNEELDGSKSPSRGLEQENPPSVSGIVESGQSKMEESSDASKDALESLPLEIRDTEEEGELNDSDDEGELPASPEKVQGENANSNAPQQRVSPLLSTEGGAREDFGIDESRPEEEQLDYGEDDLEDKLKDSSEPPRASEQSTQEKSDGEVDSASDGEIKSDADGEDFEEGETRDHPLDLPPEQKKVCKFFEMGNCTWGDRCRYLHPGINDKGNYNMFSDGPKRAIERRVDLPPVPSQATPFWEERPPFIPPPAEETAWEKGLRHAKEMRKKAIQRKVQEPDFMQKREVISVNIALNEDKDMEFVNNNPVTNKGFDPFEDIDNDEFATPDIEEVRRQMNRDRRRLPPPMPRHLHDRRLPPPPDHSMTPSMRRDRRPPSPRHRQERYPPEARRAPPRHDVDHRLPPNDPGLVQHHGDRRDRRDVTEQPDNRGPFVGDSFRREAPQERGREEKFSSNASKGLKESQNGGPVSRSDQWNDPWARGRPQAKGRNKSKEDSSSGSSSGSSSRSSSRSSGSSHSSASGSSRSSSRSSVSSSSFSSDRDSSRSPSPSRDTKPKKKVLTTAKQRNGAAAAQKKPLLPGAKPITAPPKPATPVKPVKPATVVGARSLPVVAGKPPGKKPLIPSQNMNVPKPVTKPPIERPIKPIKRTSSSSSEFSRSSDSSASPSRAKSKSGSGSESESTSSSSNASSSSGSSSSDSDEDDKPQNRRKAPQIQKRPLIPDVRATAVSQQNTGKVMVPSRPGRKDVKMTIIEKQGGAKKRPAAEMAGQKRRPSNRRSELLDQLKAVEDAIARKRAKLP